MSQGLTWIAARRMPLVALVALLALTVGMFAAVPSARAAQGDVTAGSGFCVATTTGSGDDEVTTHTVMTALAGGDAVTVETGLPEVAQTDAADEVNETIANVPCDSDQAGLPVTVTPDGSITPIIEVKSPSVTISINDSDGIIPGGQDIMATVTVKNLVDATPLIQWIRVSGVLDGPNSAGTATKGLQQVADNGDRETCATAFATCTSIANVIEVPDGTSEGEYTISARINYDDPDSDSDAPADDLRTIATKTFTVGDPGLNVAAASLELGTADYDDGTTVKDETKAEDGSEPANGNIWLKVAVTNSLGNPSNASGVNGITVFATGGATLQVLPSNALGRPNEGATGVDMASGPNSATLNEAATDDDDALTMGDEVGSTMFVKVTKTNKKPGTVNVWAIVTGSDGSGTTDTLDLVFTGGPSELTLGEAANVARLGKTEFSISATDGGGNATAPGRVRYSVTDADGKAVGSSSVSVATGAKGDSTPDYALDDNSLAPAGIVTIGETTASGQYTITASIVGVSESETTTTVTVSGAAANIELTVDDLAPDAVGQGIVFTATVTDEDGNAVADGTDVTITASDVKGDADSVLVLALKGADNNSGTAKTKNGVATGRLVVVGDGSAVVTATSGAGFDVVVITSTAGEDAAVDEADVEPADGLSQTELNNFASWSGEGSVSASELLAGIAGASGVLFYDGDSWQRYGVVDGQVIPGSRDFTIRSGQTIWISG